MPEENQWRDVGNVKAREKTSQALREGAPELRNGKDDDGPKNKRKASKMTTAVATDATASESNPPPPPKQTHYAVLLPQHHPVQQHGHYVDISAGTTPGMGSIAYHTMVSRPSPPPSTVQATASQESQTIESQTPVGKKRRLNTEASPATVVTAERTATPTSFTATVSADDDDGRSSVSQASSGNNSATNSPQTPGRGPRLKLLKRRLQATA